MKIIEKYLFFSIFKTSIGVLFSLVIVFSFFKFLDEVQDIGIANYDLNSAINYLVLLMPSFFNNLLVLGVMIGTILSVGKLDSNRELQIFQTGCISAKEIVLKTLKYPFLISLVMILILDNIAPITYELAQNLKDQKIGKPNQSLGNDFVFKQEDYFVFIDNENDKQNIKIFEIKSNQLEGYFSGINKNHSDGNFSFDDAKKISIVDFRNLKKIRSLNVNSNLELAPDIKQFDTQKKNIKTLTIFELTKNFFSSYASQESHRKYFLELSERLIKPLTLVGMILIAVPLIFSQTGRGTSLSQRVFIAITIGTISHLLFKISLAIMLTSSNPSYLSPFVYIFILFFIGFLILYFRPIN